MPSLRFATGALATVMLVSGCGAGEHLTEQSAPRPSLAIGAAPTVSPEIFTLCKAGSAATFSAINGNAATYPLSDGECVEVLVKGGPVATTVSVTETAAQSGLVLDRIEVTTWIQRTVSTTTLPAGSTTAAGDVSGSRGVLAVFYNRPVELPGGQGCTPGYWKQRHHFDSWTAPYDPTDKFADHFEDAFPGKTLLDVLSQGGGGLKALGRHTVAALLNGASPGVAYGMTAGDVINAFNAAFPGSKDDYEALKNRFARANESGCPLN